ncbi:hypothetical protein OKW21_003193 [Catalinimonas alkaloidigena]|nr:hypothetical protein [Catalinimonas alkaloidigena]
MSSSATAPLSAYQRVVLVGLGGLLLEFLAV